MLQSSSEQIANEILDLYQQFGYETYGENVTQIEHMVQSAQLAEQETFDEEVILAAFLHDIGHICGTKVENQRMEGYGTKKHEAIGADFLRERGFSDKVAALVEGHVLAKRYLCFVDPQYLAQLSSASTETLRHQGGPMDQKEAEAFERTPFFELSLRMRYWDEEAKIPDQPLPSLEPYRQMIISHLT